MFAKRSGAADAPIQCHQQNMSRLIALCLFCCLKCVASAFRMSALPVPRNRQLLVGRGCALLKVFCCTSWHISSCSRLIDIITVQMLSISLPPLCALFRAACQCLIGRVARYAPSSHFGMHLRNNTQLDGN